MAPFCPECGVPVDSHSKYCECCGSTFGGSQPRTKEMRCPVCKGRREISMRVTCLGLTPFTRTCGECEGTGRVIIEY